MEPHDYIYLIQPEIFVNSNEPTYKIGKINTRDILAYIGNTYKNCHINLITLVMPDCNKLEYELEHEIIKKFNECFIKREEYGMKYYSGDVNNMMSILNALQNIHYAIFDEHAQRENIKQQLADINATFGIVSDTDIIQ